MKIRRIFVEAVKVLWGVICLPIITVLWRNFHNIELFTNEVSTAHTAKVKNILSLLKPKATITDKHKIRVGSHNDGGYVMLDSFEGVQVVYGMGIGDNFSWETDISHRVGGGVDVLMYDPTISPPVVLPPLKFYKLGICGDDTKAKNLLTFEEILKKDGNFDKENMILKIDVEGAEWGAFETTSQEILEKFSQIVVEFHDMLNLSDANYDMMMSVLDKLSRTHEVIHVHANNNGHYRVMGGIPMPNALEVTYLRKKDWEFGKDTQIYPINDLDNPNQKGGVEFILAFVKNEFTE